LFEGSPNEAQFVLEWIAALRASAHKQLQTVGILIPAASQAQFRMGRRWICRDSTMWRSGPAAARAPSDAASKADYFDSLFHSSAVVGINTSALIEGGIVGRPVHTFLLPNSRRARKGHCTSTICSTPVCSGQAAIWTSTCCSSRRHCRTPMGRSIRTGRLSKRLCVPHGLGINATEMFVDAVERLASTSPAALREPVWTPLVRAALRPIAGRTSGTFVESVGRQRRYREKAAESAARNAALQVQRAAEKAQTLEQRRLRAEMEARERDARVARHHEAKQLRKMDKLRDKEQRLARQRREKQRQAWKATVAKYYRRLIHSSSGS
jgi:hypothetical protein